MPSTVTTRLAALAITVPLAAILVPACGSKPTSSFEPGTPALPGLGGSPGAGGAPGGTGVFTGDGGAGPGGPGQECAKATFEAKQAPAAMLVVLDRSSSMAENGKWIAAAQAIVQALDADVFDSMQVGLYAAPSGTMSGPSCIFGLPVACQAPPFPQVSVEPAGALKSGGTGGVRAKIKQWLTANAPDNGLGDASPLYGALQASVGALKAVPLKGKRILLAVTDGTISCNEFSNRPGFADCNGCQRDWEDPNNIARLVASAHADSNAPIETFVVGVPGADTSGAEGCSVPPYRMRLALSAIAAAGAPDYVPAACDGRTFTQSGAEPQLACHFDMTTGFGATKLADAIAEVRGKVLGCTFELPKPAEGDVDPNLVNVVFGESQSVPRRRDANDACAADYCWDYDADGKVQLIGKACEDLKAKRDAKVNIVVGCKTQVK